MIASLSEISLQSSYGSEFIGTDSTQNDLAREICESTRINGLPISTGEGFMVYDHILTAFLVLGVAPF
jgi:hypothetical protein